ncbi:MAG: phosphate ABC transporter permease PstA [Pseudomonadota bacterium]
MTKADDWVLKRLRRRKRRDAVFEALGVGAVLAALGALLWLLLSVLGSGVSAFSQHFMILNVVVAPEVVSPDGARDEASLRKANYRRLVQQAMEARFPQAVSRSDRRALYSLVSMSGAADEIRTRVVRNPDLIGRTIAIAAPTSDDIDQLLKGRIDRAAPEALRRVNDRQIAWADALVVTGEIKRKFNTIFFTRGDSRDPELAGIAGAAAGSALALLVTFVLAVPIGVGAAVYLEEFAPKNRLTALIEVNINNLAAVPSVIFGLLGLAVFLNAFGMPRSAPLVGGMVLALMTLPTVIIATRAALKAVPPSVREGALALGASPLQATTHHVLPMAAPGVMTGSIIGMAQALGETAPLLMIGMVAFVTQAPSDFTSPATVLPVQIFLWSDSPERAWEERASAAIIVLLGFLIFINLAAILLRRRFQRNG